MPTENRVFSGWGLTAPSAAEMVHPHRSEEIAGFLASAPSRGVLARGLGRSYGDAAQNGGGLLIDATALQHILAFDIKTGVIEVEAGLSLDSLLRATVPQGWFVGVTPGTRYVTVGGAIACDIHGKNHHRDGSFSKYVLEMELCTPTGVHQLKPDSELFWATAGGMGLTGIVTRAKLQLLPVDSAYIRMDTHRAPDLDSLMDLMESGDAGYRYTVAWVDLLARGRHLGRSVLTRGDFAKSEELQGRTALHPLAYRSKVRVNVPAWAPGAPLTPATVRIFNEFWYRKAPRQEYGRIVPLAAFFHPLDGIGNWNRLYGKSGFLQWQIVLPFGAEDTLRRVVEYLSHNAVPSFLAVLKRFGEASLGHLSFPRPGWTLALDVPAAHAGLGPQLDLLDQLVMEAQGRIYLAKDSRVRPEWMAQMYPRLDDWRRIVAHADPKGILRSDLGRRLGLKQGN